MKPDDVKTFGLVLVWTYVTVCCALVLLKMLGVDFR